jgi:hypothetical protein
MGGTIRARERLRVPRIEVRFLVEGREAVGYLRNVSRAGVFIAIADPPRPGAAIALQFYPPIGGLVDIRGEVRWNTHGLAGAEVLPGFGVLIQEPPPEYLRFFLWAVDQAKKERLSAASDPA